MTSLNLTIELPDTLARDAQQGCYSKLACRRIIAVLS